MRKALLITIFDVPNYGSVLQTFATIKILFSLGYQVQTLNYTRNNDWVKRRGGFVHEPFIKKMLDKNRLTTYGRLLFLLNNFRRKHLQLTKEYNTLKELEEEGWEAYDLFITGSDQVWNTRYIYGDKVYYLSFVPQWKKKISIASSFAMKSLPQDYILRTKEYLQTFSALSVREQNGKSIIEDQLGIAGKHTQVILDPTLILSRSDWERALCRSNFSKRKPYILFYMLDYAFNPKPYIFKVAKFFKEKMKCDVYALAGYKNPIMSNGLIMKNMSDSSIEMFIDLFINADLVITSSFHGTAFAINFGIPLVSIVPNTVDDRQSSLLSELGLSQCAITVGTELGKINPFYNLDESQEKLQKLRLKSLSWIKSHTK